MTRHDISDEQWEIISLYLKIKRNDPRERSSKDIRQMLNSSLWILRTGAPWRDFPIEYGPWQTVYKKFARWAQLSVWDKLLEELEKSADSESISIDASYVKLYQHRIGAKEGTSHKRPGEVKAD
jgi:transposase